MEIEDETVAVATTAGIEKFQAGGEFASFKAFAFEQKPKGVAYSVIIVQDENHPPVPARNSLYSCPSDTPPP
jgi:hypothetical protein